MRSSGPRSGGGKRGGGLGGDATGGVGAAGWNTPLAEMFTVSYTICELNSKFREPVGFKKTVK